MHIAPESMTLFTLCAVVPYRCPLNSPCSMNLLPMMSSSIFSLDTNRYSRPETSLGRFGREVSAEIDVIQL